MRTRVWDRRLILSAQRLLMFPWESCAARAVGGLMASNSLGPGNQPACHPELPSTVGLWPSLREALTGCQGTSAHMGQEQAGHRATGALPLCDGPPWASFLSCPTLPGLGSTIERPCQGPVARARTTAPNGPTSKQAGHAGSAHKPKWSGWPCPLAVPKAQVEREKTTLKNGCPMHSPGLG